MAVEEGLLTPPVLLVCPPADLDTSLLPAAPAVFHDSQPEHDFFAARHEMRAAIGGEAGSVIVSLPQARDAARDRIARAMQIGCPVLVDGRKTSGVDAMLRDLRRRGRVGPVIAKAHGKLFVVEEADIADWIAEPKRNANGYLAHRAASRPTGSIRAPRSCSPLSRSCRAALPISERAGARLRPPFSKSTR
jgi:16S rRNA (guanine1207-N2)-methyltransferase